MSTEQDEVFDIMREATIRQRGYADFDSWPDRRIQDRGIGAAFVAALRARDGVVLPPVEVVPQGEDPPDLWAGDIAIELTELVDEDLVRAAARQRRQGVQPNQYRDWSAEQLAAQLGRLIQHKDTGRPKGNRHWREYWLVVHTDEPGLTPELVAAFLNGWEPAQCQMLTRAFLLMSYFPDHGRRPLFDLSVDQQGGSAAR